MFDSKTKIYSSSISTKILIEKLCLVWLHNSGTNGREGEICPYNTLKNREIHWKNIEKNLPCLPLLVIL